MKWKDSNDEMETVPDEEGTFEEDYSPLRTRKLNLGSRLASVITRPGSWLVVIPLVLLVIVVLSIRPGGSSKALLSAMDQRLQNLENKMRTLDGIGEQVADFDKNRQTAQLLTVRLDRLESSFAKRISEMEEKLRNLQTKPVHKETKPARIPAVTPNETKPALKTHVVKKGETLYSISKKYGLSVSQLMTLNKLSKGTVINPGQKLKIQ